MKILTKEEAESQKYIAQVGFRRSEFTDMMLDLTVGQSMLITRVEWKQKGYKQTPRRLLTSYYYNKNSRLYNQLFTVRTIHEGWVITKI
jgi:hypothetical protein